MDHAAATLRTEKPSQQPRDEAEGDPSTGEAVEVLNPKVGVQDVLEDLLRSAPVQYAFLAEGSTILASAGGQASEDGISDLSNLPQDPDPSRPVAKTGDRRFVPVDATRLLGVVADHEVDPGTLDATVEGIRDILDPVR